MAIFKIRISNEPDARPIYEMSYVIAPTRQAAIKAIKIKEGVEDVLVLGEFDENQARQFTDMRSAF